MNTGKYVFAQVADFIPRYEFDCIVKKYDGDYHVRDLTCYKLFLHMMFGQLTVCNSIRDICLCLKAHQRMNNSIYYDFISSWFICLKVCLLNVYMLSSSSPYLEGVRILVSWNFPNS